MFLLTKMRPLLMLCVLVVCGTEGVAQQTLFRDPINRKGGLYMFWGWNWAWFTRSDITFTGADYNFTLHNVKAADRQTGFDPALYFNPSTITIPQYNARIGYYFRNHWDISIGMDHMKYVVQGSQTVQITGTIDSSYAPFGGSYTNQDIVLVPEFLKFEHTDGLNFLNVEARHSDLILDLKSVKLTVVEGAGVGMLIPKTNTNLLGKQRYDAFHVAGYGISTVVGLNVSFFNVFFFQSELKGGFLHLPDIRTTHSEVDRASQSFFFAQVNFIVGGVFHLPAFNKKRWLPAGAEAK